jgi:ribokinase
MSVDVAVAATAFLDMTFVGLDALPGPGEERFAQELVESPGGGAITAIGCARLGLSTALAVPIGEDRAGRLVRDALEREGIALVAPPVERTAVAAVMPVGGERSFVSYDPRHRASGADVAALAPRAVVTGLRDLSAVPPGARAYVTCDDVEARRRAGRLPDRLDVANTLIVNAREATLLTGAATAADAAGRLAERVPTVVVTLGPQGALAVSAGLPLRVPGFDVGAPIDTTGAGDLLVAGWAWAQEQRLDFEARLRWAVLYAALSVTVPTGAAGAAHLDEFIEEGTRRGLPAPRSGKEVHT